LITRTIWQLISLAGACIFFWAWGIEISAAQSGESVQVYRGVEPTGPWGEAIPLSSLGKAAIGLATETVVKKPLPLQVATTGKIEAIPTNQFHQHALLQGRITKVMVSLGDLVREGQTLTMVDSPEINQVGTETLQNKAELEADIKRTRSQLDAEMAQAQAQVDLWSATYERDRRLYSEGISAQRTWQESLAQLKQAESKLEAARRNKEITLKALEVKLRVGFDSLSHRLRQLGVPEDEVAKMLKEQHTILAVPVQSAKSGVITDIQASPGLSIDHSVLLFTITDLTRVWATADIYEDDMARMKIGEKVLVKVAALPHETFSGNLCFIGRQVDPLKRTLPVRVEIPNPELKLKPDMFAELFIETAEPTLSILVPREAVVQRTGHQLVFLEEKGGYQPCRVTVGRSLGDDVEILDGLLPGQRIVIRGAFQLDAELLKSHGNKELFVQPTEGERTSVEEEEKHERSSPLGVQTLIVAVLVSFLVGFVVSAFLRGSARSGRMAEAKRGVSPDSEPIAKG